MSNKVYDIVINKLIAQLETGVSPWSKSWKGCQPQNLITGKPYRGINRLLLPPGEYATFKQIQEAGGRVKKGAKSSIIVFYTKENRTKDPKNKEVTIVKQYAVPILRYYNVFSLEDTEGMTSKLEHIEHNPIQEAEDIVNKYDKVTIEHYDNENAKYIPSADLINIPNMQFFNSPEMYYQVLFHEMIHSTGHKTRLDRFIEGSTAFGSEVYSKEELVAEIGASFLASECGIENATIKTSVAYIQGWIKALKGDKTLIFKAAGAAQKAVDFIKGGAVPPSSSFFEPVVVV